LVDEQPGHPGRRPRPGEQPQREADKCGDLGRGPLT
jgi:hypothetical protein